MCTHFQFCGIISHAVGRFSPGIICLPLQFQGAENPQAKGSLAPPPKPPALKLPLPVQRLFLGLEGPATRKCIGILLVTLAEGAACLCPHLLAVAPGLGHHIEDHTVFLVIKDASTLA